MIVLARIDDRLIHGQVVLGWGIPLRFQHIVLVDALVAQNAWEQELYRLATPPGITVEFSDAAQAARRLVEWQRDPRRICLLTGDIATMASLVEAHPDSLPVINVGGVHAGAGRTERARYVYLSAADTAALTRMAGLGARVTAQDLPTTAPIPIERLVS